MNVYLIISPIYMSNSKSFNSDIHFSEKTPQELSRSKYKKFNSTLKSEISKQISIESLTKNGKKPQRFMIQFSQQKRGIERDKSESSLGGYRTPRKIPHTPLKQINTPKPVQKKSDPLFLNELTLKFKILIRDLEKLINSIKTELKKTIQNILKNTHKQILEFLTNQINSNRQQSILKSLKQSKVIDSSSKGKNLSSKYQFKILSEFQSQNKLIDAESVELNKSLEQIPKNFIENDESEHKSGSNFSAMIKLREKIRKDANNPVRKNIKDKFKEELKSKPEFELSMTSSRGALSKKQRVQGNRVAANSIQKLQRQLNSLKNLLDE